MEYFSFPENLHRSSSVSVNNEEIFPVVLSLRNATKCWEEGVTSCLSLGNNVLLILCLKFVYNLVSCSMFKSASTKSKKCHRSIIVLINVSKLSQYLADTDWSTCHTVTLLPQVSVFASLPWWLRMSSIQEITPSGTQRGQFKCEGVKGQGMPHILLTRRYLQNLTKKESV